MKNFYEAMLNLALGLCCLLVAGGIPFSSMSSEQGLFYGAMSLISGGYFLGRFSMHKS